MTRVRGRWWIHCPDDNSPYSAGVKPMETELLGPHIRLTCLEGDECSVYIEPWGTEFTLVRGDILRIESDALLTGDVEISRVPGGIAVTFTADRPIAIVDGRGNRL